MDPDGQSLRLRSRIEPFAVLFWALGIELANTLHHSTAVHKSGPYMVLVG